MTADIAQAFRARLTQAVAALRIVDAKARVILLLDAVDHSALQAAETHTDAFSHVILKSLSISPIDGVSVVASCRSERRDVARSDAVCHEIRIGPFSRDAASNVVRLRDETATEAEVAALYTRSGGNPRVLDALVLAGRPYDDLGPTQGDTEPQADLLNQLLKRRIERAAQEAVARGMSRREVDSLLAGLALLPPPVPFLELAIVHDRPEEAIESFATDLSPLIARTPHGLIFRDEPTETLIRRLFKNDAESQSAVVERLECRQAHSTYAARALPIVLTSIGRTDDLVRLAFDVRLPESATSRVAQRAIRLSRLVAALVACSAERRTDDLTQLLLEAARVAGGHERSDAFLREHPDLVALSGDPEAVRRLFEVKSGWPGSRHASLAILHAVADELGDARRHAGRALAWLDWRAGQPKGPHRGLGRRSTDEQDVVGPAYAEVLGKNTTRVGRWLDSSGEAHAYTLYSQMVRLLENHATLSADAKRVRETVVYRAVRCRSKSRALAAALLRHGDLRAEDARRAIRRLASVSPSCGRAADQVDYHDKENGLPDALVAAAMQAVRLGQDREAKVILDGIGVRRLRLHHFSSSWSYRNDIVRLLLSVAVRAALEGREPRLMDVAPEEVHSALRPRKRPPTWHQYERAVERLLTVQQQGQRSQRKRRKAKLDYKEREEASRVVKHRIRPLLPLVSAIAKLLRASGTATDLAGALDRVEQACASAESYPYRDGAQYISRVGFGVVLGTVNAGDGLTARDSTRLVEWLMRSPIRATNLWIDVVAVLSRRPETHAAALLLAERTADVLGSDTDVGYRITASGALARAIWRASRAEAQAYFRRGLDIADAIGSDDYSTANVLIEFAGQYGGAPMRPETVHTFARICELTLHDEDKFPWTSYGEALARVGGVQGLPIVSRMADRENASLALSLPPFLTSLVRRGHLAPDLAMGLIGLDGLVETWSWSLADFAAVVIPGLAPAVRERAVQFLVTEVDRRYQGSPPRDSVRGLYALGQTYLSAESPTLLYIEELIAARDTVDVTADHDRETSTPVRETDSGEGEAIGLDPFDGAAIDAALLEDKAGNFRRPAVQLLIRTAQRVQGIEDQLRFLQAVADAGVPTLADKLLALEDFLKSWSKSMAIRDYMPKYVTELITRHADELVGSEWESSYALRGLIKLSERRPVAIVAAIIEAFRGRASEVGGNAWMNFACLAARSATAAAIGSALERFTSMAASELPEDVGDGSWRTELAGPGEPQCAVAGLLWMCLGSPVAGNRWRAAHAIRRLSAMGRTDVVGACIARFDDEKADAFQDRKLPFFFLHARLWLLIALARVAFECPEVVLSKRALLEGIAFDARAPHVGMKEFARDALRGVLGALPAAEASVLGGRLDGVNTSPFPRAPENEARRDFYHSSPWGGELEIEGRFSFDYDYSKAEIDGLAAVFGLDHAEAVVLATGWVRGWSTDVKSMWECPRRPDSEYGEQSRGSAGRHTWGAYLAWHSLMLTAGALLQERPVTECSYREEPWREWLADYRLTRGDGLWLADGTDMFPVNVAVPVVGTGSSDDVPGDPKELGWLGGLVNNRTVSDEVVLDGSWKSSDGLDVSVDSVVVVPELAKSVAYAVLTVEPFDRSLPQDGSWRRSSYRGGPLRRLFREADHCERALDRDDPYAGPTALRRSGVAPFAIRVCRLHPADPFERAWRNSAEIEVLRCEAWGVDQEGPHGGVGRFGHRLKVRTNDLVAFLGATRRCLVLLIKVQKYLKDESSTAIRRRRRRRRSVRDTMFRTQTLVAIIDERAGVRTVERVPRQVREAVGDLPESSRHEFGNRVRAIAQVRLPER